MTGEATSRKHGLRDMEGLLGRLVAEHLPTGQQTYIHHVALTSEEFGILDATRRFITWVIPYEARIREFKGRTRA